MFLKVWNKFETKTMKDDHDLHLKYDVLLLADVFEKFRNNSIKNYGLCPTYYLSTPALSCDVMLYMAKVKLELISDPGIYIFFEKGMRGGVSYISNRYSKSSNKHLKFYDPKQESKHIIHLDADHLYGYGMSKFVLASGFKWLDLKEFDLNKYISHSCVRKLHCVLEFNQSQWLKQYDEFNTKKRIEAEKNGNKDGKALYKLMNNAVYGKTMENLRNRINVKLVSNKKDYLKWTSKPSYMPYKIFENDLDAIRKDKVTLAFYKPAYNGMCILELSKVLMYGFHYDYINSKLLLTDTDSLTYEIKIEVVYEDLSSNKEIFDCNNYWTKSKYHDD